MRSQVSDEHVRVHDEDRFEVWFGGQPRRLVCQPRVLVDGRSGGRRGRPEARREDVGAHGIDRRPCRSGVGRQMGREGGARCVDLQAVAARVNYFVRDRLDSIRA